MKAGLMEIADFFVLNKADRPGVDQSYNAISTMLQISSHAKASNALEISTSGEVNGWSPFIVKTVASENRGIDKVAEGIERHAEHLVKTDALYAKRKERVRKMILEIVDAHLQTNFWTKSRLSTLDEKLQLVLSNKLSAIKLAEEIITNG